MYKAIGVLIFAAAAAVAQTPKFGVCASNEQLRHYATASDPQLSPDGTEVVYVQRESTADGAASHLWLAPTSGASAPRQITFSAPSDHTGESSPAWTPDGSAILFVARRGSERQIFRLPSHGGEAAALKIEIPATPTPQALSPGSFTMSPDGNWIAVRASQPLTAAESKDEKDKKDAKVVDEDTHAQRVWLYSMVSGKTEAATAADRNAVGLAWSPDSRRLAVVTSALGDADDLGPRHELELVAVDDLLHPQLLQGAPASVNGVEFSPSGAQLALEGQSGHDTPPGIAAISVMPAGGMAASHDDSGAAPPRLPLVASPSSPAGGDATRTLSGGDDVSLAGRGAVWSRDGNSLFAGGGRHTTGGLVRLDAADGKATWMPSDAAMEGSFATNARQSGWVFITQASDRMPQVAYRANLDDAHSVILSRANSDWAASGWTPAEAVGWQGPDGLAVEGLYFAPRRDCTGTAGLVGGKAPLILMVHGGPTGAFSQTFSPFVQWLTAQGYAVLEPNPRGSTGYGWQFAAANKNDLGGKDYQDVMAGVDWALAHEPVDAGRLGMYGYSYGGEMAGFIEGKSERFAAIVSGAPVIDQYSEYGTESGSWYDRWFYGLPWMHPEDAWRQSPLAYAGKAHTPLLLLQGQADVTDPLGQSEEMYRALRQMGVPVRLVTFPREVHGTLGGGIGGSPSTEPWHGFEAREQIEAWYKTHFKK